LLFGLWFHFWLVIITIVMASGAFLSTFVDKSGQLSQWFSRRWGRLIIWLSRVKVTVVGMERLGPGQQYVFAANHRSSFDIYVLIAILPGKILWVAKKELFRIPIFGPAIRRMGSVPVDRDNRQAAIRSLHLAVEAIQGGGSMIIFPEGTRATTPELLPFKKGVFVMAHRAGQPIAPVAINGARAVQPPGTIRVRPGPIQVIIAPPISPLDFPRKEGLMAAVREAIAANYDPDYPHGTEPA
jgi:1-acyl-sn-glycerol-3-phosphate acyltransferase